MTVEELIAELSKMDSQLEVVVSVYQPNDSGEQDHYKIDCIQEYPGKNNHAQIKCL